MAGQRPNIPGESCLQRSDGESALKKKTVTATFGASKREGHNAASFYSRNLYAQGIPPLSVEGMALLPGRSVGPSDPALWRDQIYRQSAESMDAIPDSAVALAFTSPPYNAGKDFDDNLQLKEYLDFIAQVGQEVYRVLKPGGRYVVNVAGLGRKPYIPLHAYFYAIHTAVGFLPAGEIIWKKGQGMNGNCAWGSWRSAKSPRLRDLHEYLLVFAKEAFSRPDTGKSTLEGSEFMASTLSVWDIPPASARRVGHPAPFPEELATRVIRLFSYAEDVVLDPFCGSGTTCVAAKAQGRHYAGYDVEETYCALAERRLGDVPATSGSV